MLRVTSVQSCTFAVAASRPSTTGTGSGTLRPPFLGYLGGDRDDTVGVAAQQTREPLVEDRRLDRVPPLQPADSLPDLPDGEHAEIQLPGIDRVEPGGNSRVGCTFAQLRHDIGVEQETHH